MDSVINSISVYSSKTALDDFFEQKVDFDIVLPDYCPAAMRILKCDVTPTVISKTIDSDRLSLDIQCKACIVYVDDSAGCIHSVTKTETFTKTLAPKAELSVAKIRTGTRATSVNCRLQNSRRISVKTVIGTAVKVMGNCECEIIGKAEGGGIEAVFDSAFANVLCGASDSETHINGQLTLEPGVSEIINSVASVTLTDKKVIADKVILKGEANISVVYMTGEGTADFKFFEGTVPFSEVVDVYGAEENAMCDVQWYVQNVHCELADDNGTVTCDVDASACVSVYNPCEIKMLKDVYSMTDSLDITDTKLTVESFCNSDAFSETISGTLACDMPDARIIGVCADAFVKNVSLRDESLAIDGEMAVTVYMCNEDDYAVSEKSVPFSILRPAESFGDNMRCEAALTVKNLNYSMPDDSTVAITAEADAVINCFARTTYSAIDSVAVGDCEQNVCKGVVLYYAERGEGLWDIAKKYRSSVDIIKRDNSLDCDRLEKDTMLLISFN